MKIKFLIGLAMTAFLMTACSNEEELTSTATKGMLKATVEGSSLTTRVGFDEDGSFYWSTNDKLGVTTSNSKNTFTEFSLSSGSGQASGTFTGHYTGSIEGYAVYPYNGSHSMSGTTLTYNFPESYLYTKVDTGYFTEPQGTGNSFNPAMWGEIQNGSVHLKHLGGVFCIKIEKMPVGAKKLILTADKKIAGEFTVDLNTNEPTLSSTEDSDKNKAVTIDFSSATVTEEQTGVFYVPVPVGTYTVSIQMTDGQNNVMNLPAGTFSITLRRAQKLIVNNGTVSGTEQQSVSDLSGAATQLGNSDAVAVTGQIAESDNEISIPAVSEGTTGTSTKSLLLENVANGASIKITDAALASGDGEAKKSVENFTLSIPNNESANVEELLDVEVDMPNTTVTLTGNAGVAKYGTVTSTTYENTLIINSGVTVNKVIVKKGNIRLNKGADIKNFEKSDDVEKVYIYLEEGTEPPTNVPEGFEIADAALADLQKAVKESTGYQLTADVTLLSPLVIEKTFTLDLNGHTIKAKSGGLDNVLNTSDAMILVRRGATLTIKDSSSSKVGCIDCGESTACAVKLTDKDDGADGNPAKIVVESGHLKGFSYGISGNGTRHTTEITINGGTVEGVNGSGVYHPQDGTMTVTGGEIKGADTGVELRSGTINVSGGKFVATANEFSEKSNKSGSTMIGVALAVSQHTTNNAISVHITNGEFIGVKALRENDLEDETSNNITLNIKKGTFNGGVYSKNCSAFVTGGTFSDPNVLHYLGETANGETVNVTLAKSETAMTLDKSVVLSKDATIDLGGNTLTSTGIYEKSKRAIVVKASANVTIKNGQIGTSNATDKLGYGVYAYKSTRVTLTNVVFSEMVVYAYNGTGGELAATGCTFQGWLSGWHDGGTFTNCTFTKGKAYYPAAICYGNTTFAECKFYRNDVEPNEYRKKTGKVTWCPGGVEGGYFDCNSVVSAKTGKAVTMTTCTFFNEDENTSIDNVTEDGHPYLTGWGDAGTWAEQLTIDGNSVTVPAPEASEGGTGGAE